MQNRTTIIVAHRLSTIVNVDTVAGATACHAPALLVFLISLLPLMQIT